MPPTYLDHNASSPLRPEARESFRRALLDGQANPSSPHGAGRAARRTVECAREQVARLLGATGEEIVLTSGGTESNNLAIHGAAGRAEGRSGRIVTSAIEHPSVLGPVAELERRGIEVVRVRPDRDGVVGAARVLEGAGEDASLVSVMLANNEVGSLQPIGEMGGELRRRGILFHCDASQAPGKVPLDVERLRVDLLTIAGHKFGGPQGAGALYVRKGVVLRPLLDGGGQELNRRPGTENVPAIAALGAAAEAVMLTGRDEGDRMRALRDRMEEEILRRIGCARVNGRGAPRVPNTSSLAFERVAGETLVIALDLEGFAVSTGAACSTGTMRRSHVLEAMGRRDEASTSIRVSLGPATTQEEIESFVRALERVVDRVRSAVAPALARG